MSKEVVGIKSETLQKLRIHTIREYGKLRGCLGREVETAINDHLQKGRDTDG